MEGAPKYMIIGDRAAQAMRDEWARLKPGSITVISSCPGGVINFIPEQTAEEFWRPIYEAAFGEAA